MSEHTENANLGFRWGLPEIMARKNIRFALDLHRRLTEAGCDVSRQTVNQWVGADGGEKIRAPHLAALCRVLDCEPQDLLIMDALPAESESDRAGKPARRAPTIGPISQSQR